MKAQGGLRSRLVQVLVTDPTPSMFHGEVIFKDGVMVGDVRAATYGNLYYIRVLCLFLLDKICKYSYYIQLSSN